MKIHILYPFKDGPYGGANQFLKAIRNYFISIDSYTEDPYDADIMIFNSSPYALVDMLPKIKQLKKKKSNLVLINRIDGPVFLIRDRDIEIDRAFYKFNDIFCDGTIFQSKWSKINNHKLGMKKNRFETTILNAPNPDIFNRDGKVLFSQNRKIKLIATSWSNNWKKGFDIYQWLDENLDFNKYEMTFVGNSPVKFNNIIHKEPMDSERLSKELKQSDIFITASQKDPCSNSLIEALHCGLPSVTLKDGGHPEIIGKSGEIFSIANEVPHLLDIIVENYLSYQQNIDLPNIHKVGEMYYEFLSKIYSDAKYEKKKMDIFGYLSILTSLFLWRVSNKIKHLKKTRLFK